jgi:hypothetical protein
MMSPKGAPAEDTPKGIIHLQSPSADERAVAVFQCRYGVLCVEMHPGGDQEVTVTYRSDEGGSLHLDRISDHQARISVSPPTKEQPNAVEAASED